MLHRGKDNYTESSRIIIGYSRWRMQGGNHSKVLKPHTQGHSQESDHHVQETAGSLVGIDSKIWWIGEDIWRGKRCKTGADTYNRAGPDCEDPHMS